MRLTALTSAAVIAVALLVTPATALSAPPVAAPPANPPAASMLQALQRDLGLTEAQVRIRQAQEDAAPGTERLLRSRLGARFAGAWFVPAEGRLAVGVLDSRDAALVRAAGALPVVVRDSEERLNTVKATLDRSADVAAREVHGWYVDVATNSVVVTAGDEAAARTFVAASGLDPAAVRIVTGPAPRPLYDIRGGDQYVINRAYLCSVGFSVNNGGFVTAGHCGNVGDVTIGHNNARQGAFAGSSFPVNDSAWVRTNSDWTPRPWVSDYSGGNVLVAGSNEAPLGSSTCRSGRTTGWHCGTIQAKNATVNYGGGEIVYGLTQTNACAEPGDSGGAWISVDQAQGLTSGGSGDCSIGGTTFFQPINEALNMFRLTLTVTGNTKPIIDWQHKCINMPVSGVPGQRRQMWDCRGTGAQSMLQSGRG